MQFILTSFHLTTLTFSELLHSTGGVVAGSAALAAYLNSTSIVPNDLDIWVHSDSQQSHQSAYEFIYAYFLK